jgi:photosystem II stability/assembly factor-like uncharacterized protein
MSHLSGVSFTDSLHGWIANDTYWQPRIFHTDDGGAAWTAQYSGPHIPHSVSCVDLNNVWAGCDSGVVLRSSDGGITWTPLQTGSPLAIRQLKFVSPLTGWAVQDNSDRSPTLHTTDGGTTWSTQNWGFDGDIWDFVFVNQDLGWAVGGGEYREAVRHTTDGGETWVAQEANHPGCGVSFVDPLNGWITGSVSLLSTNDGGQTWIESPMPPGLDIYKVSFADDMNGFISCLYDSRTLHTSDGGVTWDVQSLPTNGYFLAMSAPDARHCWLASWDGVIVKWNGSTSASPEQRHPTPVSMSLSSFPNPFNPRTVLSFDLPSQACASLSVYDLTGRLVQSFAERMYPSGRHQVTFDGSNLATGVYFARLKTDQVATTHKLLLLK